jgi:hypothetical protein
MKNLGGTWVAIAVVASSIQHIACADSSRQNQPPLVGAPVSDGGAAGTILTREGNTPSFPAGPGSLTWLTRQSVILAVGTAHAVPSIPSFRTRVPRDRSGRGGLPWPDGDATFAEYDHYQASFRLERLIGSFYDLCLERLTEENVHTETIQHFAERFPRYLDAEGGEMTPTRTPPEMERSYPSYWNRGPNRTLVEGERILAAILCWPKAACRELGGCSSPLFWKFPVSSDDRVDLSSLPDRWGRPGPSRLPLDAVYSFLADEHHPPPNDVSPLPPTPPSDGGSYPGRR